MAARGRVPPSYDGRAVQAPGMVRHAPYPELVVAGPHRPEPPPSEVLEHKIAAQAVEIERLIRENQRLAATHVALRQEIADVQKETQRIQTHMGNIEIEGDIQIRGLLEKIAKMEADIRAGDNLKKDLQQAHLEAQNQITARHELTSQIKETTQELQKVLADVKALPDMEAELDRLRLEHQKLRAAFEYEKGLNIEQVERMRGMERNLISMAREVEILHIEVLSADKKAYAPHSYSSRGYGIPDPTYSSVGQGFVDAYGRPQVHMSGGTTEGINAYGGVNVGAIVAAGSGNNSGERGGSHDAVRSTSHAQR